MPRLSLLISAAVMASAALAGALLALPRFVARSEPALDGTWEARKPDPDSATGFAAEGHRLEIELSSEPRRAVYFGLEATQTQGTLYSAVQVEGLIAADDAISLIVPRRALYPARPASLQEAAAMRALSPGTAHERLVLAGRLTAPDQLTLICSSPAGKCPENPLVLERVARSVD